MRAVRQTNSQLSDLFTEAGKETARGSQSFHLATQFFPRRTAQAAHAVYWFCRYTDDLVDECENVAQGKRDLDEWQAALRHALHGGPARHPVLLLFTHVLRQYRIPVDLPFELIEGMRMDLHSNRYANFDELRLFCYRAASVVGLMMCSIIGFEPGVDVPNAQAQAVNLGIAMQLTNILRDISEDLDRGRIYLPQNEMHEAGYSEADLKASKRNPAFLHLMRLQGARAHSYYERGNAGIVSLHRSGRFAVKLASDVYGEILARIDRSDYDVFSRRMVVSPWRKRALAFRNLAAPYLRHLLMRKNLSDRTI